MAAPSPVSGRLSRTLSVRLELRTVFGSAKGTTIGPYRFDRRGSNTQARTHSCAECRRLHPAQRVVVGVIERFVELLHVEHGRLVVRPRTVTVDGDRHAIAARRGVGGEVRVLADRVRGMPSLGFERER